jgi:hypothetical protein
MSINANTKVVTTSAITTVPHDVVLPEFLDSAHLEVYECEDSANETAHSVPTLLSEGSNYTVSQNSDGTGTLTVSTRATLDANATIVVVNNPPVERDLDIMANGRIDSDALEAVIDRLVLQVKLLQFQMNRCVRFDETSIQAGVDDVAPLQELPPLKTDDLTNNHALIYDKATGTMVFKTASEFDAL